MNTLKECLLLLNYTWQHKKAFLKTEKKVRGFNSLRGYLHDTDKLFLYWLLLFGVKKEQIQKIHRRFATHHVENSKPKNKNDLIEMAIDWECAPITKPDKPLLAFSTMIEHYPSMEPVIMPIIAELGMLNDEAVHQALQRKVFSETKIRELVLQYQNYAKH